MVGVVGVKREEDEKWRWRWCSATPAARGCCSWVMVSIIDEMLVGTGRSAARNDDNKGEMCRRHFLKTFIFVF